MLKVRTKSHSTLHGILDTSHERWGNKHHLSNPPHALVPDMSVQVVSPIFYGHVNFKMNIHGEGLANACGGREVRRRAAALAGALRQAAHNWTTDDCAKTEAAPLASCVVCPPLFSGARSTCIEARTASQSAPRGIYLTSRHPLCRSCAPFARACRCLHLHRLPISAASRLGVAPVVPAARFTLPTAAPACPIPSMQTLRRFRRTTPGSAWVSAPAERPPNAEGAD